MRILVLGHTGLLGSMVYKYFTQKYEVETTNYRWGTYEFTNYIKKSKCEWLINCIGCIPQQNHSDNIYQYYSINTELPIFLSKYFHGQIIHPSTDCEFSGKKAHGEVYHKTDYPDATDNYGLSKKLSYLFYEHTLNTWLIRASIIGPERKSGQSLWNWFYTCKDRDIFGYTNHYWNGVTTLTWAKHAAMCIEVLSHFSDKTAVVTQIGTVTLSKYDILDKLNTVLNLGKNLIAKEAPYTSNKCLALDYEYPDFDKNILETYEFYYT